MNILITGASSGFGEAIAEMFAAKGHNIVITARREDRLKQLEEKIKGLYNVQVFTGAYDIREREACFNFIQSLPQQYRPVDVLVNNAGGAWGRDRSDEAELDDWEQMLDTNVKGTMYMTKAVLPEMTEVKNGHIINIGSIAGKEAYEFGNGYNAAKFAIDGFTKALRIDLLPYNIKVTHIAPGAAETEFSLVRFKGDKTKAASVYAGYEPLHARDIADIVYYVASQPPNVCINDLVVTPTAQANSYNIFRSS